MTLIIGDDAPNFSLVNQHGETVTLSDFAGKKPVAIASSMQEAVEQAARVSVAGDVVLLSPGCTSFDWYGGYAERGDHFAGLVRQFISEDRS